MPRPRPNIPLPVQVLVAERQLFARGDGWQAVIVASQFITLGRRLPVLLWLLWGSEPTALDHDPPLRWRTYTERIKNIAARYTPNANDPDHLIWRTEIDHKIKTNVAGEHGQFPDRVLIKRERNREKNIKAIATQGRPSFFGKAAGRSRPIQNGNRWPPKGSRPFQRRRQ